MLTKGRFLDLLTIKNDLVRAKMIRILKDLYGKIFKYSIFKIIFFLSVDVQWLKKIF